MNTLDILIVDDNVTLAESLQRSLEGRGQQVRVASSIDVAMEILLDAAAPVVLASATLPHGGGVEVARRVKARGARSKVLILSTGGSTARVLREAQAAGASGVVPKMAGPRVLWDRVKAHLPAKSTPPAAAEPPPAAAPRGRTGRTRTNPAVLRALSDLKRRAPGQPDEAWDPLTAEDLLADDDMPAGAPTSEAEEHFRLGMMKFRRDDFSGALTSFARAWSLDAGKPRFLAYKARCQQLTSGTRPDPDGSLADDLRMVVMLAPRLLEGHLYLGHLYAAAGRKDDARRCFRNVLELDAGNQEANASLRRVMK